MHGEYSYKLADIAFPPKTPDFPNRDSSAENWSDMKMALSQRLERFTIPGDSTLYPQLLTRLRVKTKLDYAMLRSVLQDRVFENRRRGADYRREEALLYWLAMK